MTSVRLFCFLTLCSLTEWVTCLPVNQREAEWRVTGNLLGKGRELSFNKSFTFILSVCPNQAGARGLRSFLEVSHSIPHTFCYLLCSPSINKKTKAL